MHNGARRTIGLVAIALGTMIGPLDSSVNIAFPRITQDFGIPIDAIQWVVVCYVLTHSSLMLAFGKLGDLMGHKRVFRLGLILCAIAFILCATASSFSWLLFARVGQGLGMGYVRNADGVDRDFLLSGDYELDVASERVPAKLSLQAAYDPKSERVKM